jgi:hypothetical protein
MAAKENSNDDKGEEEMKHNVFDTDYESYTGADFDGGISHADFQEALDDMKRYGSLKESALQHGITDIEYLFP